MCPRLDDTASRYGHLSGVSDGVGGKRGFPDSGAPVMVTSLANHHVARTFRCEPQPCKATIQAGQDNMFRLVIGHDKSDAAYSLGFRVRLKANRNEERASSL